MTRAERDRIEERVAAEIAAELMQRVAWSDPDRERLLNIGQQLIKKMGWDQVIEESLLPMLDEICKPAVG